MNLDGILPQIFRAADKACEGGFGSIEKSLEQSVTELTPKTASTPKIDSVVFQGIDPTNTSFSPNFAEPGLNEGSVPIARNKQLWDQCSPISTDPLTGEELGRLNRLAQQSGFQDFKEALSCWGDHVQNQKLAEESRTSADSHLTYYQSVYPNLDLQKMMTEIRATLPDGEQDITLHLNPKKITSEYGVEEYEVDRIYKIVLKKMGFEAEGGWPDWNLKIKRPNNLVMSPELAEATERIYNTAPFPTGIQDLAFKQKFFNTCFVLSGVKGMSLHPEAESLFAPLIRTIPGTDDFLFCAPGNPNTNNIIRVNQKALTNSELIKEASVGPLGLRIIEKGYNDMLAESKHIFMMSKETGGLPHITLQHLTGWEPIWLNHADLFEGEDTPTASRFYLYNSLLSTNLETTSPEQEALLKTRLEEFAKNPQDYILVANTSKNSKLYQSSHACTIKQIDPSTETVTVHDPLDSMTEIQIPYKTFFQNFNSISGVRRPR